MHRQDQERVNRCPNILTITKRPRWYIISFDGGDALALEASKPNPVLPDHPGQPERTIDIIGKRDALTIATNLEQHGAKNVCVFENWKDLGKMVYPPNWTPPAWTNPAT